MTYIEWQQRHPQAAAELHALITNEHRASAPPPNQAGEDYVQSAMRLEGAHAGVLLHRNNVGALQRPDGGWVRFGLANDSPAVNKRIKSADLIGIRRRLIVPADVGTVIGQYVSRECKRAGWKPGEDRERETAQYAWAALINQWGGDAKISAGPGSF